LIRHVRRTVVSLADAFHDAQLPSVRAAVRRERKGFAAELSALRGVGAAVVALDH
jgi:hypothetical protein